MPNRKGIPLLLVAIILNGLSILENESPQIPIHKNNPQLPGYQFSK